jgi:hypothetical protein
MLKMSSFGNIQQILTNLNEKLPKIVIFLPGIESRAVHRNIRDRGIESRRNYVCEGK